MSEFDVNAAIEAIADKVHQGWAEAKIRQGFADHPWDGPAPTCQTCLRHGDSTFGAPSMPNDWNERYPYDKHHPDMLPYAELPENVKGYNRATARMVFAWLEENGWQVVRKET